MKRIINFLALCMFIFIGGLSYAFVFDVEPISPEKAYSLERDVFMRSDESWNRDFPSFQDWMNCRDEQEAKFHEWVAGLSLELGIETAIAFDPWYQYQDTSQGHAAVAPDNWARGDRD